MHYPASDEILRQVHRFNLKSACQDCFYFDRRPTGKGGCNHNWPNKLQAKWPLPTPDLRDADRYIEKEIGFCKEFELA